jgi:dTDP-4-dehydrorhamnose reductase
LAYRLLTRSEMDIADEHSVDAALALHGGWAVINAAGYVRVDEAELDRERCFRENTDGPAVLARACAARGLGFLTISSDLVFDGARGEPYDEDSTPVPLNVYGESKAAAERVVLAEHPGALVIRTSAFFGPWDSHNFVTRAVHALKAGESWTAAGDMTVSPTYVPDLVDASLDLLIDGESGIWHLANQGAVTWAELARRAAELAGLDASRVRVSSQRELGLAAVRPSYSALRSRRADLMPSLEHALQRFIEEAGYSKDLTGEEPGNVDLLEA